MNRTTKIVLKILYIFLSIVLSGVIIIYSVLWIYINDHRDNEAIENYKQRINIELTEDQAKIIWFAYTNNKNYGFTWYPLIFDIIFEKHNNIDLIAGEMIVGDFRKYKSSMEARFVSYAMKRYVNRKINWKECIEIIASNMYFSNKIFGIENASKEYYKKSYKELTEKELIGIIILEKKPFIQFDSINFNNAVEKIYNEYIK